VRRDYELGFILNPEVSEEQNSSILERIQQIVNSHDGQVMRINQWGRRRLAYPIEHQRDGFYVFFDMILTPETVFELDRNLKVTEEVLRHIIIRRDPKIAQKEREEREARAAAQAAAAAQAQSATPAAAVDAGNPAAVDAGNPAAVDAGSPAAVDAENIPASTEDEMPIALPPEEMEYVPSAIEEEETAEAL
jgi:small subunit ribosomal protein S6